MPRPSNYLRPEKSLKAGCPCPPPAPGKRREGKSERTKAAAVTIVICQRKARDLDSPGLSLWSAQLHPGSPLISTLPSPPMSACFVSPSSPLPIFQSPCPLHVTPVPARADPRGLCRSLPRPPRPFPSVPVPRAGQGLSPRSWVGSPRGELSVLASPSARLLLSHRGCTDGGHHRGGRWSWRGLPRPSGNHCGLLLRPLPEKYGRETRELGQGDRGKGRA